MTQLQIWLIVMVFMVVFELITVGNLISVWFAIGAFFAMLTSMWTDNILIQVIVFGVTSLLSLFLIRPITAKALRGNSISTNADRLIGRQFKLSEAIKEDQWGTIKVNGVDWSVTTVDQSEIEKNETVEVLALEGVKLIVKKV
ncbi:NfeD family protein [Erysipelothrix inopinata]|uniref:NfeD family protein n=1 Tax=Erysipelothrix inopinata TaxID=225084 RepID=A0A7G9RZZ2_9FIRM|nr:NfeD family protein [Erysipelothrix inopinata]QNN61167.1 NfeD family protein [Erysipelothrix inopinata]